MLKHNKKRNSYLIYEQLLNLVTRLSAAKKVNEANFVCQFIKENFSPKTVLGQELKIFKSILETKVRAESASSVLSEAVSEYKLLNEKQLKKEKTALINAVNKIFGEDFFQMPVKNYKLMASAAILLSENKSEKFASTPEERVKISRSLVEHMTLKENQDETPALTNFEFKVLIDKYNENYSAFVNEDQKDLLQAWLKYSVSDDKPEFKKVISEKVGKAKKVLNEKGNVRDEETKSLIIETKKKLSSGYFVDLDESKMYELMRIFDVTEDLEILKNEKD